MQPAMVSVVQGFDKYGVGAYTCVPTVRLQKALGFKVAHTALLHPANPTLMSPLLGKRLCLRHSIAVAAAKVCMS